MLLFLLQAAAFLPPEPPPPDHLGPDESYRGRLEAVLAAGVLEQAEQAGLRPATPSQRLVLSEWLRRGNSPQVRLASVLAAGEPPGTRLSRALFFAACQIRDEGAALAAILAARAPSPGDLPGLAYLALDPSRPLSVRAAAVGRLLEDDCGAAWPVARTILREGTTLREDAPWRTWERTGRYELPKRTLLISLDTWLRRHDLDPPPVEPNAAWATIEEQIRDLEPVADLARRRCQPSDDADLRSGLALLLQAATRGDLQARRALTLLHPHSERLLTRALASSDAAAQAVARLAIQTIPQ